MDLIISSIGFAQSIIAFLIILTKRPLRISYLILSCLILVFTLMFGLDILSNFNIIVSNRWFFSLSFTMLIPPLFYLYAKHITTKHKEFASVEFLHFAPSLFLLVLFLILNIIPANRAITAEAFYIKYNWLKIIYGLVFQVQLIFYTILSLKIVIKFKKQLKYYYSYDSYKISLDWLIAMIIIFFMINLFIVISSIYIEINNSQIQMIAIRGLIKLFFVYILGIWGFNQNQLNSADLVYEKEVNEAETNNNAVIAKYQKSGLKEDIAKGYIQTLVKCMEESEVWKDTELSISKLSNQSAIPKHHLSEVLNEHLGKSFYEFVNEYRVEYAKQLLVNKDYGNWSIIAIAYECGFNSKNAFNISFKKYTHQTPSEFKKDILSNPAKDI